jgi:hypothetical protein
MKRLQKLEKDLENKLDCDIFDNEVNGLRALIGNLESGTPLNKTKLQPSMQSSIVTTKDFSTKEVT